MELRLDVAFFFASAEEELLDFPLRPLQKGWDDGQPELQLLKLIKLLIRI